VKAGQFGEAGESEFTAEDIRFTQKGETVFALVLDRPAAASITFKSLGAATPGTVERVALVASGTPLSFRRDAAGLTVNLPANLPGEHVFAFKIQGRGLTVTGA
jgi:alpha-L-fucosidase